MKLYFMPIQEQQILQYLKQSNIDTDFTENMLKQCEGSIGKALKIIDKKEKYMQIEKIIQLLEKENITQIWRNADVLYQAKEDIIDLLDYMEIVLYNLIKYVMQMEYL